MKTVYKIGYSITAPRLRAVGSEDHPPSFLRFNGESKLIVWPKEGLQVAGESRFDNIFAFYNLAPGVLVYRDDLLVKCEEVFWLSREGTERLPLRCGSVSLEVANVVDFLSPESGGARTGRPPCPVDKHYKAIIRIRGQSETDLFCVSGVAGIELNEFKGVYDYFGFKGLTFTQIWRGEG